MLPLSLLVLILPLSRALTLEEIWHKKWEKTKLSTTPSTLLSTTPSTLYHPGIVQHGSKGGKQSKESKPRKESTSRQSESFCSSAGCVRAAADLLQKMDQAVDPCQVGWLATSSKARVFVNKFWVLPKSFSMETYFNFHLFRTFTSLRVGDF